VETLRVPLRDPPERRQFQLGQVGEWLARHTSSVSYAPSADSAMALSYESPTVPSSRISEIERGAQNLPEPKQRVQTLDNV